LNRFKVSLISLLGYWAIRLIGATLRWEIEGLQSLDSVHSKGKQFILTFWHGRIFMATYYFRDRGIVVMTSQNRDGEYIARVIQRFGYRAVRGSSSRGSHRATVECLRAMKDGKDLGLTIDGPRGPRYVAKPGAVYLAKKSGNPVIPFNVAVEKKWVAHSWDQFQIPKPFSRAIVLVGDPIYADAEMNREQLQAIEAKIQSMLDELRDRSDAWWEAGRTESGAMRS
jgi:lysophospholipid acyltransferase (LPLAT)-like uncharacterized protein